MLFVFSVKAIHDGMITRDDVDHTLKGLTEKEGAVANKIIEKWWNTYILKGRNKMTKNEFIKDLQKQYTEDKHMQRHHVLSYRHG
jgi:hypothetical protein